jgi:hypothetical protein
MINKNKLIKILSFTTLSIFIIVTINSLLDGKYFDAIGYFCMGFHFLFFHNCLKKNNFFNINIYDLKA